MKALVLAFAAAAALASGLSAVTAARAETISLVADLSGASSVPPNDATGTGRAGATFDTDTRVLRWQVTYEGLSGPMVGAHIHGPSEPGANAGIVVGFDPIGVSPIIGSFELSEAQAVELLEGLFYVNLHTALHPGGEIRGHLIETGPGM
ncbi:MAG TPA: CHRD domain-containing protein [Devosiaceae bacterium]|nr:CHRD domain-containing protein [Devosiaceae bacterium]